MLFGNQLKVIADKEQCNECGVVTYNDPANDYCRNCDHSTEWTLLESNIEVDEIDLGINLSEGSNQSN